jgi:Cytochrome B561
MAASVSERYHLLVSIHEPLGIAILALVVIRFINRLFNPPPPLPAHLALWQRLAAQMSHYLLYALMFVLPLVGWAMLSAARYPIVLYGPLQLPALLPHDAKLYAELRQLHTYLALLLFATFLGHLGAALFHGLIYRDGVFTSMMPWRTRAGTAGPTSAGSLPASDESRRPRCKDKIHHGGTEATEKKGILIRVCKF